MTMMRVAMQCKSAVVLRTATQDQLLADLGKQPEDLHTITTEHVSIYNQHLPKGVLSSESPAAASSHSTVGDVEAGALTLFRLFHISWSSHQNTP